VITYSEESFEDLWPKMQEIIQTNWEEVGSFKDRPVDPDYDRACQFQNAGMLLCCAAWDGDRLVGYILDTIQTHPHYKTLLMAQCDTHFILKEYRAKCARGLTRFVEKLEKEMGVEARVTRAKNVNRAGDFFRAMGYFEGEVAWVKRF